MLIATLGQVSLPPPLSQGPGKDFNCTSKTCSAPGREPSRGGCCYGAGPNDALFQDLQAAINAFAADAGFAPVPVNGFIDDATVEAGSKAAAFIRAQKKVPLNLKLILTELFLNVTPTRQTLAARAPVLRETFRAAKAALEAPEAPPAPEYVTPPEIFKRVEDVFLACRRDPNDPLCHEARNACRQMEELARQRRKFRAEDAKRIQLLCATLPEPLPAALPATTPAKPKSKRSAWWIAGGVSAALLAVILVGVAVRRKRV